MQSCGGGTLVSGKFGIRLIVRACKWFGLGMIALIGSAMQTERVGAIHSRSDSQEFSAVVVFLMLAGGLGIMTIYRYLARNDPQFITDFLIRTLDAKVDLSKPLN
jgi:hypothetical protein